MARDGAVKGEQVQLRVVELRPLLVRAPDAARLLAISERLLWTLTNSGQVPCVRGLGRRVLYSVAALEDLVREKSGA
jgi:predicted DNA-binding transcriptional regulator AlpA